METLHATMKANKEEDEIIPQTILTQFYLNTRACVLSNTIKTITQRLLRNENHRIHSCFLENYRPVSIGNTKIIFRANPQESPRSTRCVLCLCNCSLRHQRLRAPPPGLRLDF